MKRTFFTTLALVAVAVIGSQVAFAQNTAIDFNSKTILKEDVVALKKALQYPQIALQRQIEGQFDILVYIGQDGRIVATNYELADESKTFLMKDLISAATDAVSKYKFSPEYNGSAVRIPFSFKMMN